MRNTKKVMARGAAALLSAVMTLSFAGGVLSSSDASLAAKAAEYSGESVLAPIPPAPVSTSFTDPAAKTDDQDNSKQEKKEEEKFVPSEVKGPVFSKEGGFYTQSFAVNLSLPKELEGTDSKIYYTLDGSVPDPAKAVKRSEQAATPTPSPTPTPTPKPNGGWGGWGGWGGDWNRGGSGSKRGVNPNVPKGTFLYEKDGEVTLLSKPVSGNYLAGTVVRAVVVDANGKASDPVTQSYFVGGDAPTRYTLPVVSLVTDPNSLYDSKTGLFNHYDESGREWERPGVFQFYVDGKEELDMNIGIRLHGAYSRQYDFKSFRLYARDEYDTQKWFKYDFFEDSVIPAVESNSSKDPIEKYKHIILRAGGNEASAGDSTMFRDALIQSFMTDTGLDLQSYQPAIVFLNGDYYGMMNIRERFDQYYFSTHYNISKDKVAIYNFSYDDNTGNRTVVMDEGTDEDKKYLEDFYQYVEDHDLSQAENYAWVTERLDMENYMNYIAVQLFCCNHDWPGNNCRAWRYTGEPMDAYGLDGKIRFCLFDTEYSLNLYGQEETKPTFDAFAAATASGQKKWPNQKDATVLLRKLLENDTFRIEFCTRYMDLLNTRFSAKNTVPRVNEMAENIKKAFNESSSKNQLGPQDNGLKEVRNFLSSRGTNAFKELQKHAGVGNQYRLTLAMNETGFGSFDVNTIKGLTKDAGEVNGDKWTGFYGADMPVTVTAVAAEGYHFSHWKEFPENTDATYVIDPSRGISENVELTPVFAEGPDPRVTPTVEPESESEDNKESASSPEKEKGEGNGMFRTIAICVLIVVLVLALGITGVYLTQKSKSK